MLDRRLQGRQYDVYLLDVRPEDGHARCKRESRKERQALDPFTECRWMLQEAQAAGATRHEDESLPVGIEHLCEDIVIWMSDVQDLEIFLVDRSSRKIASTMTVSMIDAMMMMKCKISFSRVVMPALDSFIDFARRPRTVSSPVATTTPSPLPETQLVPCMPMHLVSR